MNKETLPTRGAEALRVEPFSGNALYYHQGMRQMDGYMTVKEVCALTGLTGKHLYYFHHEHIVRAVAYAITPWREMTATSCMTRPAWKNCGRLPCSTGWV